MSAINNVLVVGGGFSGMVAAIELRKKGIAVDLLELDKDWRPEGTGISLGAATLRALQQIGLYEEFLKAGHISSGAELLAANGALILKIAGGKVEGSDVQGEGGILRPKLAKIMSDKVVELGTHVILGETFQDIEQRENGVHVSLTNGTAKTYDLVIGAEGVHSKLRTRLFPESAAPSYVGQGVWRAVLPKPAHTDNTRLWLSDSVKVGINPCSDEEMYMFITEIRPSHEHIDKDTWADVMAGMLKQFPDQQLQALIPHLYKEQAAIDYRPLYNMLLPMPWNKGRIVLIGDSVAATTPHLASGACIGIESAIVLAEEIANNTDLTRAFDAFHQRRFERCRMVVENSAKLADIEINHGDKREHGQLMNQSFAALAKAI